MKYQILKLVLATIVAMLCFSLACNRSSDTDTASSYPSPSPTQAFSSPEPSPSVDSEKRSVEFGQAISSGYVDYQLSGWEAGDSSKMNLRVKNKTERVWEVNIEVGTKLEPEGGDVQRMVVTKEYKLEMEPHDEETLVLEVSCLDISKAAPSLKDNTWRIARSNDLAQFIGCANIAIDVLERNGEVEAKERPGLIQYSLWQARGATREDWIDFLQEYGKLSEEEAQQEIEAQEPYLHEITKNCPSLLNI